MSKPSGAGRLAASLIILAGMLTASGVQAAGMGDEYFKKADTNSDGLLTREEMTAARMERLGGADTDKDGFISASELSEHRIAMMRANQDKQFARFSERFDANKDGKVSTEEIKAFEPPFFSKADADKDGKLSAEEMKAVPRMMHEGMGEHMKGKKG